jgi:hypothetical protein
VFGQVLTRAAIVLSVGWSLAALPFVYGAASGAIRVAWNGPWVPPAGDLVLDCKPWERDWTGVPPPPEGFVLDDSVHDPPPCKPAAKQHWRPPTRDEQSLDNPFAQELHDRAWNEALGKLILFALVWAIPMAGVWSLVWIVAPLSRNRS